MNELEDRLTRLLEEDAQTAPLVPEPPARLRTKVRRRQFGTVAVSALTVLAIVGVSVAGLRTIQREAPAPIPADLDPYSTGRYPIFERTATIEAFTIFSPSNWYLVNQAAWARHFTADRDRELCGGSPTGEDSCVFSTPGGGTVPLITLSNVDHGLRTSPCLDNEYPVRSDEAIMTIAIDRAFTQQPEPLNEQRPLEFGTTTSDAREPCGPGTYRFFSGPDAYYLAYFAIGQDVSSSDREALAEAFETMREVPDFSTRVSGAAPASPAYVIAGGTNAAGDWRLELRPSDSQGPDKNVDLGFVNGEGTRGTGDFTVPSVPIEDSRGDPTFGAVTKEATGVQLQPEGGEPSMPATLVPLPPSMPFDFDLFFAENPSGAPARAVPLGLQEPTPSASFISVGGNFEDARFSAEVSGPLDAKACIRIQMGTDRQTDCQNSGATLLDELGNFRVWTSDQMTLFVGVIPLDAALAFTGEDGTSRYENSCSFEADFWQGTTVCAMAVPPTPTSGTIEVTTKDGETTRYPVSWGSRFEPVRVATGTTNGTPWALDYVEDRQLVLVDPSDEIVFDGIGPTLMSSLSADNPMIISEYDFGIHGEPRYVIYGVSRADVDELVIGLAGDSQIDLQRGRGDPSFHTPGSDPETSAGVWWLELPPGPVVASITAFDAHCNRLGRAAMSLQAAVGVGIPPPVTCQPAN